MEFIYDRTQEDVDRVKELNRKYMDGSITENEKAEWAGDMKGAFNFSDMKRVVGNIKTLAEVFDVSVEFTFGPSNTPAYIPRINRDYNRILECIQKIKAAWFTLADTPETPKQPLTTYQKWNDIERILHDLNYTYEGYINGFSYCGTEMHAGEGIGDL